MRRTSHPMMFLAGTTLMAGAVLYASEMVGTLPPDGTLAENQLSLPRLRLAEADDLLSGAATRADQQIAAGNCAPDMAGKCRPGAAARQPEAHNSRHSGARR